MNNPINETNFHDSDETISSNMANAIHDVEAITMLMPKNGSKTDNANDIRCLQWSVEYAFNGVWSCQLVAMSQL
jgi:hypothetical protein